MMAAFFVQCPFKILDDGQTDNSGPTETAIVDVALR